MGPSPEWGPSRENHLVRSTSVVREIVYRPGRVEWSTFDGDATDQLRLTSRPLGLAAPALPQAPTHGGRVGLVVEGGAMRGIFAAGVLDVFLEQRFCPFDFAIGVSVGASNLLSFLAGQ